MAAAPLGAETRAQSAPPPGPRGHLFSPEWLMDEARRIAAEPYVEPASDLPSGLGEIGYDQYRDIAFRPEARIWADLPGRFRLDLLHRGFIFKAPVEIALVEGGRATPLLFSPGLFDYGPGVRAPTPDEHLGFSGFRVRSPLNTPDFWDEFLVFQGASYFRAVAREQAYGISARALAINTAAPEGEEFPAFRRFWIEKPAPDQGTLIVHALLDSPSATGVYRFAVTPGAETVIDVEAALLPRRELQKVGIAPLTSMFLFDGTNRAGYDDFRPAVHDSNGLQMLTGAGEWLWRPLANPRELQISTFKDAQPRGFGLMQRARRPEEFEDFEAAYERRPSLWIEPAGDWGQGYVELVEIPTESEINDNIVAYWRPDGAVPSGGPWRFGYRMRWTDTVRPLDELLVTRASRMGRSLNGERRLFVVDFASRNGTVPEGLVAEASASAGEIAPPIIHAPRNGIVRVSFELAASDETSELRLRLMSGGRPASETWLYRWTSR
jgi:periplasmic glucans biosynthesis protein